MSPEDYEATNISCSNCEAQFLIEYSPEENDDREPEYCPFCGDEILGEIEDDEEVESYDYDRD